VGGAVRDALMGIADRYGDDDFVVRRIPPDGLDRILSRFGDLSYVGKAFGVYKFTPAGGRTVDIAYPRRERSIGVGHRDFDVVWDSEVPIEVDLARRDFTINAIAIDVGDGRIIDPHGGQRDIAGRRIRMIFPEAFREDALRILRGVRFATRFGFAIDGDTEIAMRSAAGLLDTLSAERVREELNGLLSECDQPGDGFRKLQSLGALHEILPELARCDGVEQNEYHPDDVFVHSLKSCDAADRSNLTVRWAALMHDIGKVDAKKSVSDAQGARVVFYGHEEISEEMTRDALERLRCSRQFTDDVCVLVANHMFSYSADWKDSTVRRFIRRVGQPHLDGLFALRQADCRSRDLVEEINSLRDLERRVETELALGRTLKISDLAVGGRDLMESLGIRAGETIGQLLRELLEDVTDDPALNHRGTLLKRAKKILADASGHKNGKPK